MLGIAQGALAGYELAFAKVSMGSAEPDRHLCEKRIACGGGRRSPHKFQLNAQVAAVPAASLLNGITDSEVQCLR
jgi:hypothetical protein